MVEIFTSKESRRKGLLALGTIWLIVILFWWLEDPVSNILMNTARLKPVIEGLGMLGPLVFILINVVQVVVAPVPGQLAGLVSGYFYGPWLGTLYTLAGTVAGSFIAFWLARKYGRPFVESVINKQLLEKFDDFSKEKGELTLFVIFLLPIFPDDAICFIAGLTEISMEDLLWITTFGRLPGFFVLNLLGAGFEILPRAQWMAMIGGLVVVSIVMYVYRKNIEDWLYEKVLAFKKWVKKK